MATRSYSQVHRAAATERTRRDLIDAIQAMFGDEGVFDPPLDAVAERAGVSTRTLLRHFGSKEGLVEAAIADAQASVEASRAAVPGDTEAAIRLLIDHYEETGEQTMRLLAEAERYPVVKRVTDDGKAMHLRWVEEVFAPDLEGLTPAKRRALAARLATVTDLYLWELLRRRYGMTRKQTEDAIRDLVEHTKGTSK